jgi:hypothetical protein
MPRNLPLSVLVILSIASLLAAVALIFVSVYTRDSIGNVASLLLNAVAIAIAVAVPAFWRRRQNRQPE